MVISAIRLSRQRRRQTERNANSTILSHNESGLRLNTTIILFSNASIKSGTLPRVSYGCLEKEMIYLFQYGWVQIPIIMPTPIPINVSPVICMLKPWTLMKITGKAWKLKYRIPRTNALLF